MSAPRRKRDVQVNFRVSQEELALIEQKMSQLGTKNREAYKSRYGYVCVTFNGSPPDPPYCEGEVCRTPEELFDHLLIEYESFAAIQLTKGRREENNDDEEQVHCLCQKYLDRRETC